MRTATFAAVVLFAAVLFFAPAAAQEAQPAATVSCSEAADTATWRFYTGQYNRLNADGTIEPLSVVYDFDARSNIPTDRVSLHVEQYAGDWNTRLSIPEDNTDPYATGSTRLQARQWTDVGVRCEGEGDVTLTVTRRREVWFGNNQDSTEYGAGPFAGTFCAPFGTEAEVTERFFDINVSTIANSEEHFDFAVYAKNPDTYINLEVSKQNHGWWGNWLRIVEAADRGGFKSPLCRRLTGDEGELNRGGQADFGYGVEQRKKTKSS